jgi:hypothetical protein
MSSSRPIRLTPRLIAFACDGRREVALDALTAAYCRGLPSLNFPFGKLRLTTASLQYQNGPARVLLRHLKPARLLVGWAVSRSGSGSNGWDPGAERNEVRLGVDVRVE